MPDTRCIVTGFEPWGEHARNPSGELASALGSRPDVRHRVLPVAFDRAGIALRALLSLEPRPAAILLLGLHRGGGFRLERVALNLDDCEHPDVDGALRRGRPIEPGAPAGRWSTLPLEELAGLLDQEGLPWDWSRDAGGYVCNHAFHVARSWSERHAPELPCGLVHVPPFEHIGFDRQLAVLDAFVTRLLRRSGAGGADRGTAVRP